MAIQKYETAQLMPTSIIIRNVSEAVY